MSFSKTIRSLGLSSSFLILAACGGGGGDSGGTTPPPAATFTVGGTVTGHTGSVVLANAGANITVAAGTGTFTVLTAAASGATYAVTVATNPSGQTCAVANGTGSVASANVSNIAVTCTTNVANTFTVGGTVSGLGTGLSVVLQAAGYTDVTVSSNAAYTFAAKPTGTVYAVSVKTQPTGQTCTIPANASGTIAAANITNVNVTCTNNPPGTYTVSAAVSGLVSGGTVVLRNNGGNDLSITSNTTQAFTTAVTNGSAYAVTVFSSPATLPAGTPPGQNCVTTGTSSGTSSTNVTVNVSCTPKDTTVPTISARTPLAYTIGTALSTTITATFSELLDTATVTAGTFTVKAGNLAQAGAMTTVPGALAFTTSGGGTKVTFTPTAALSYDTDYVITATAGVKDVAGNAVAATSWNFNTGKYITAGGSHACVRFADGRAKCWGYNLYGQLGIDSTVDHGDGGAGGTMATGLVPVIIPTALTGRTIVSLAAGDDHTCAIVDNGRVFCWGNNARGELGNGFSGGAVGTTSGDMALISPVSLGAGRTAIQISVGNELSCALLDDYSVKCWGSGDHGALAQGDTVDQPTPVLVNLGTGRTAKELKAGGGRGCAILDNDTLKCWGDNQWGQAGAGVSGDIGDAAGEMASLAAVNLGAVTPLHVAMVEGHTCVLTTAGAVRCFGLNTWGEIGNNAGNGVPHPSTSTDCGTGGVNCWGDTSTEMSNLPEPVAAAGAVEVIVGFRQTCARLASTGNPVKCWGTNEHGEIGLGTNAGALNDVGDDAGEITSVGNAILRSGRTPAALAGGGFFQCVTYSALDGGQTQCWGQNNHGQVGMDNNSAGNLNIGDAGGEMGSGLTDINFGT